MEKQLSLDALRVFAVAAKHLNFTNAAKELHISQSAVSQQINKLEKTLGFVLFSRKGKGLELTEKGLRLRDAVRDALGRLEHTIQELRDSRLREALTVRTLPSIAVKWFMPRLTKLRAWAPELTIAVDAELALPDFLTDGIDVAIAYGRSDHPEWDQTFLFEDAIFPVCAPSFLADHRLESPTDLEGRLLLHDSVPHGIYSTSWDAWFVKLGMSMPQGGTGPAFSTAALVSESAVAGQGVALTRYSLVADHLAAGNLVRLFDTVLYEDGFYLVCPKIFLKRAAIRKFYEWACKEAADFKAGMRF